MFGDFLVGPTLFANGETKDKSGRGQLSFKLDIFNEQNTLFKVYLKQDPCILLKPQMLHVSMNLLQQQKKTLLKPLVF